MRKITDLIDDALKENDYKFRINFLLGGLMSCESNDSVEKERQSTAHLKEIMEYIKELHFDDEEKSEYFKEIERIISSYLDYAPEQ